MNSQNRGEFPWSWASSSLTAAAFPFTEFATDAAALSPGASAFLLLLFSCFDLLPQFRMPTRDDPSVFESRAARLTARVLPGTAEFTTVLQPSLAPRLDGYCRSAWHPPSGRGDTSSIGDV